MHEMGASASQAAAPMVDLFKSFASDALKGMGIDIKRVGDEFKHFVPEDTLYQMEDIDDEVESLADALEHDLPKGMRTGAEKFKRGADQIDSSERLIARGFGLIGDGVSKLNSILKLNKLQTFLQAVSLEKMHQIGSGLAAIGSTGGQLTTQFEAAAQAASVGTRKVIAATGLFGKELTDATAKAAGLEMGMKVSSQTAGHAVASMSQFGKELKALGIDSAETAVKLEDGLGISVRDLGFNLKKMRDGLNLSDKELADVSKAFTATGESIHDMQGPLQHMGDFLQIAQRRSNLVAQGLSSIGGKDSLKSMNAAVRSLFVLTGDAKGAQDAALGLETKMIESMENFRNMFSGTSNDLDAFLVNTSVVTGDVRKAFQAAANGPDAFIKEFGGVIAKLKKGGKSTADILKFFGGQMSEALGPDMANTLVAALANADEAKMKMINDTKAVGKAVGDVAKESWRSSMTMQESFDLMMGAAESRFRNIGRAAAVAFMGDTKKAFDSFNNTAEQLSKEGGPLGKLVDKMSEISSLGAKALLPEALRPMAQIFSHLSPMVFEAVTAFSQVGPVLMSLVNPLTLVVAAIGLLHMGFKQTQAHLAAQDKNFQASKKASDGYAKQLSKLKVGSKEYIAVQQKMSKELNYQKKIEKSYAAESRKVFIASLKEKIHEFGKMAKEFLSTLPDLFGDIGEELKMLFQSIDWGEVWETIKAAFAAIPWDKVLGTLAGIDKWLRDKLMDAFDAAIDFLQNYDFAKKWDEVKAKMGPASGKLWQGVLDSAAKLPDQLGNVLKGLGPRIKVALANLIPAWLEMSKDIQTAIGQAFIDLFHKLPDIIRGLGNFIVAAFNFVTDIIEGVLEGIENWLVKKVPGWAKPIHDVFYAIRKFIDTWVGNALAGTKALMDAWAWLQQKIVEVWDWLFGPGGTSGHLGDTFKAAFAQFEAYIEKWINFFSENIEKFKAIFSTTKDDVIFVWNELWNLIQTKVSDVVGTIKQDLENVLMPFESIKNKGTEALQSIWDTAQKLFGHSINTIVSVDMDKTVKVLRDATDLVKDYVEKGLYEAVVKGITTAFATAFKNVFEQSKKFFSIELDAFKKFTETVQTMIRQMWIGILEDTELAAQAAKQTISGSLTDLEKLKVALDQMKMAKLELTQAGKEVPGQTVTAKKDENLPISEKLLNATNKPEWWTLYSAQFDARLNEVVLALKELKTIPAAAAAAATPARVAAQQLRARNSVASQGQGSIPK